MKNEVTAKWLENMAFETEIDGHKFMIDAKSEFGGENRGPRPKSFMKAALAGCTAMDVVSMLKKMRVPIEGFNVKVDGELTDEHPKQFKSMHVIYEFTGKNLPMEKLQKAVNLSEESYCGVSATYKQAMKMTSEIKVLEA